MFVRFLLLIVCAGFSAAAWCQEAAGLGSVVTGPGEEPLLVETELDPIDEALGAMSLEQKIAQLMFVTFDSGHNPSSDERRILKGYTPGGVLIPNVVSPANFEIFVRDLRLNPVEQQLKVPILIGTNFYALSGRRHTSMPYAPLPSLLALGASRDPKSMAAAAGLIADYISTLGVGLHFGPSLGLSSRLEGATVGFNQFGEDPVLAIMGARAFGEAFLARGVCWMPMAFPGGDANRTGQSPAVLVTPRNALLNHDLAPYREAIAAGARFIHVGNVLVPTIEADPVPASVSYTVLTTILKEELGFGGIAIAGPMDDPDLSRYYEGPDAPIRALMAGAGMVWWAGMGPRPEQFVGRLFVAVQQNEVPASLIDERVRRILEVKSELGLLEKPLPKSKDIQDLIKQQQKNILASNLEQDGIVFLKVSPGMLPLSNERSVPLGITGVAGVDELHAVFEDEKIEPIGKYDIATAEQGKQVFTFEIDRVMKGAEGTRVAVCIFSADILGPTQREILRRFNQFGTRTITVILGLPADIDKYLEISDTLIVMLRNPDDAIGPAMKALADVLLGRGPVRILEPSRDLAVRAGEPVGFDIGAIAVTPAGRLPVAASELLPAGLGVGFSAPMDKRKVLWDFGDGATAAGPKFEHAYAAAGHYTPTVWIQQNGEEIARGTFGIQVAPASE